MILRYPLILCGHKEVGGMRGNGKKNGGKQRCRDTVHITERQILRLFIKGLQGSSRAYRRLGYLFLKNYSIAEYRKLGELCLLEAVKMGDEEAYFLYHRLFSRKKQVIDDQSYLQFWNEYQSTKSSREKERLRHYLLLGTNRQKKITRRKPKSSL